MFIHTFQQVQEVQSDYVSWQDIPIDPFKKHWPWNNTKSTFSLNKKHLKFGPVYFGQTGTSIFAALGRPYT